MIEADGLHDFGVQVDSFANMLAFVYHPVRVTVLKCSANILSMTISFRSSTFLVIDQGNQTLDCHATYLFTKMLKTSFNSFSSHCLISGATRTMKTNDSKVNSAIGQSARSTNSSANLLVRLC